jgi:hypothetical protein
MANPSTNPSGSGRPDQSRRALICSRGDTMPLDAEAVHRGCRNTEDCYRTAVLPRRASPLPGGSRRGRDPMVGCTQEAPLFSEIAEDLGSTDIRFVRLAARDNFRYCARSSGSVGSYDATLGNEFSTFSMQNGFRMKLRSIAANKSMISPLISASRDSSFFKRPVV